MATIYDIAEQAEVSTATVSRVLNGSGRVSEETRQRVETVAQRLNYQPHLSAKSLARQKTDVLSVVIPVMANNFYVNVMRGIQEALDEKAPNYDLIAFTASNLGRASMQIERASQRGRSDGLMLLSVVPRPEDLRRLRAMDVPVVLVDSQHPEFDSIAMDNVLGGYLATRHLIEQGFERIAHLTVPQAESVVASQRREGYEKALQEAERPVEECLVVERGVPPYEFREDTGRDAMAAVLDMKPRPDAVFAVSDTLALGAMETAKARGVAVPEEIAIIGFDDIRVSRYVGLSTLSQPMRAMGKRAVETLLQRLDVPHRSPASTIFSPSLVERATTRKPPP